MSRDKVGKLLKYGYHKKVDYNSKWITGIGLIIGEREVKQTRLENLLYKTLSKTYNNTLAKPQEYKTLYTVLLEDGTQRQLEPTEISQIL
jgi:hypothetical protein